MVGRGAARRRRAVRGAARDARCSTRTGTASRRARTRRSATRGAQIVAHENTKLWLGTEVWVRWSDEKYPPLPKAARPTTTFYESRSFRFGDRDRRLRLSAEGAHGRRHRRVLPRRERARCGRLVVERRVADHRLVDRRLDRRDARRLRQLLEIANERTRIVPASGPLMTWDELYAQQQMYLVSSTASRRCCAKRSARTRCSRRSRRPNTTRVRRSEAVRDTGVPQHVAALARSARHEAAEHRLTRDVRASLIRAAAAPRTAARRTAQRVRRRRARAVLAALAARGLRRRARTGGAARRGERQWPLLEKYCYEMPRLGRADSGPRARRVDADEIAEHAEVWEKVVRKLRGRMMPPPGGKRPDNRAVDSFVAWLEASLDQAATGRVAGHLALHRLNRTEYANAIRDLLALDVDPRTLLPADDPEDGFDNVADALQVSPSFIEQYLSAARTLRRRRSARGPRARSACRTRSAIRARSSSTSKGLPLGTRGGALVEHYFPSDGEYRLNIGDLVTGLWVFDQEHENTLIATLDGKKFFELKIGGGEDMKAIDQIGAPAVDEINARLKNIPFTTTAGVAQGRRDVPAPLVRGVRIGSCIRSCRAAARTPCCARVSSRSSGPSTPTGLADTASRDEGVPSAIPKTRAEEAPCATQIVDRARARGVPRPVERRGRREAHAALRRGRGELAASRRASSRARGRARASEVPLPRRDRARRTLPPGAILRAQRPRARVAAVVLPLEHGAGRGAAEGAASRQACASRTCSSAQVKRMLADPRSRDARVELRVPVARARQARQQIDPDPDDLRRRDRRHPREDFATRGGAVRRQHVPRRPQRARPAHGEAHLSERDASRCTRHQRRARQALRRVELDDSRRWGLLGKGARAARVLVSEPHVAGAARRVGARAHPRHAAGRRRRRTSRRSKRTSAGKPAAACASGWRRIATNPSCNGCHGVDGSARLRARELRRRGQVAREGSRGRHGDRRVRRARRTARRQRTGRRCATRCSRGPISSCRR